MKIALKTIGIILLSLLIAVLLFAVVTICFKALDWFPDVTRWADETIYSKIGLTFYSKM